MCAMLAAHPSTTPQLTALLLHVHGDLSTYTALVAALASNTQLVELHLCATARPSDQPRVPVPSEVPQLRSLNLTMPVVGSGAEVGTPLGLGNLSAMHMLTKLVVAMFGLRNGPFAVLDQAYAAATMQPVAQALASLTALRTLQLSDWTTATSPAAHASW